MGKRYLPSIEALTGKDDELLIAELKVRELREHVAVARTLLDAVDELPLPEPSSTDAPTERAAEELARLGCRIVELASAISRKAAPISAVSLAQQRAC